MRIINNEAVCNRYILSLLSLKSVSVFRLLLMLICSIALVYGVCGHTDVCYADNKPMDETTGTLQDNEKNIQSLYDNTGISEDEYKDIDKVIKKETGMDISFENIVRSLLISDNKHLPADNICSYIAQIIISGRENVIRIVALCIFSALINLLVPVFNEKQLKDTTAGIISVALITLLLSVFLEIYNIAQNTITSLIEIYKVISMVFFPVMCASGLPVSAAGYYQLVIWMMNAADVIIKNILMNACKIYICIYLCDCISVEAHFTKLCACIQKGIKWCGYMLLTFFMGLNCIKSIINPLKDSIGTSYVYKAVSVIPGIGDAAAVLSQTIMASSSLVRNAVGAAGIITLVICIMFPLVKMVIITFIYHGMAAVIEPVADKRITRAVSGLAGAIGSLSYLVIISSILFILTIMLICIAAGH